MEQSPGACAHAGCAGRRAAEWEQYRPGGRGSAVSTHAATMSLPGYTKLQCSEVLDGTVANLVQMIIDAIKSGDNKKVRVLLVSISVFQACEPF